MVGDMEMLETGFRGRVTEALNRAASSGQDPVEYLNRYGLLASPQWEAHLRARIASEVEGLAETCYRDAMGASGASAYRHAAKLIREGKK